MQPFSLFAGKVNFNMLPCVQDKNGVYYVNAPKTNPNGSYYEPIYTHFYDALPDDVVKHTDGSHFNPKYPTFAFQGVTYQQQPIDVYMTAWTPITSDFDWIIGYNYGTYNDPVCYVIVYHGEYVLLLGHCYTEGADKKPLPVGTVVHAGDCIVKSNPSMGHAHLTGGQNKLSVDIAEMIMKIENTPPVDPCPVELARTRQELETANGQIETQAGQITDLTNQNKALTSINAKVTEENKTLTQEKRDLQKELAIEKAKNKTINITISENKVDVDVDQINIIVKNFEDDIDALKKANTDKQARIDEIEARLQAKQEDTIGNLVDRMIALIKSNLKDILKR